MREIRQTTLRGKRTERKEASEISRLSRTHSRSTRRGESTQRANDRESMGTSKFAIHSKTKSMSRTRSVSKTSLQHIAGSSSTDWTRAVSSIKHLSLKFQTPESVGVVRGDQMLPRDCYHIELQHRKAGHKLMAILAKEIETKDEDLDPRVQDERNLLKPVKELEEDQFSWSHGDMIGIDPSIICHHLNIDPNYPAKRQKRRPLDFERQGALKQEVDKLLVNDFTHEVFYPSWIANLVLIPKPNGTWRTCIDFSDLNKACPKDCFPLPKIDQLVDATAGHELMSFIDAYSGYN
ncbi:hypothetical protein CsatB_029793 [Cannabis sativa]